MNDSGAKKPRRCTGLLVQALIESEADLVRLSKTHFPKGSSLRLLASWYETPETSRLLRTLRALAEERANLVVAHARSSAARRMMRLATDSTNAESARKACFDLLKLPSGERVPTGRSAAGREAGQRGSGEPDSVSADELEPGAARALLERLASLADAAVEESASEDGEGRHGAD